MLSRVGDGDGGAWGFFIVGKALEHGDGSAAGVVSGLGGHVGGSLFSLGINLASGASLEKAVESRVQMTPQAW